MGAGRQSRARHRSSGEEQLEARLSKALCVLPPPTPQPISENRSTPGNTSEQPLVPILIPLLYPQGASRLPPPMFSYNLHPPDPGTPFVKLHLSFLTSTPSPCPRLASLVTKVASNLQVLYSPPVLTSLSQVFSKSLSKELLVPKGASWRWRFP